MSPSTVSENGVVGQATSFDLTLTGETPYTYTQTFGNICNVSINDNIATVSITPTETGTLTGSITFNEEATCNITIAVSDPQPTVGLQPSTVTSHMMNSEEQYFDFTLLSGSYDSSTEEVDFSYTLSGSTDFTEALSIQANIQTYPEGYELIINTNNETGETLTGTVNVYAKIYDADMIELLRTYTATINLTIG